jgi:hypothetical protein
MSAVYSLGEMDPHSFEHLANALAFQELGAGLSTFSPGSDGGRDGLFEGTAPFPSATDHWTGTWYIQSKHHAVHLSTDSQKWLLDQIRSEVTLFQKNPGRHWPDNWIIVSNVDPSGVPATGCYDAAKKLIEAANPTLANRFAIWGGAQVIRLLDKHTDVRDRYLHLMTPGHVVAELLSLLRVDHPNIEAVTRALVISPFLDNKNTTLDQAGSHQDEKPGMHEVFSELPYSTLNQDFTGEVLVSLRSAAAEVHKPADPNGFTRVREWRTSPVRARAWFLRGGPGQGKSTVAQFLCQIQRSALILENSMVVTPACRELAIAIKNRAIQLGAYSYSPRVPIWIDLKQYAQWIGTRADLPRGVLSYMTVVLSASIEQPVLPGLLKAALGRGTWLACFDGLDEVPPDAKNDVAAEVIKFIDEVAIQCSCDLFSICTSRPQGYSGQFDALECATVQLDLLDVNAALRCAIPVLRWNRSTSDADTSELLLREATKNESVLNLMRTPLQSHIMAVVIRDGGRPPERRWELFNTFYKVIHKREVNRRLPDLPVANLLSQDEHLLRTVHNRVGFLLHAHCERAAGAETSITREEFLSLVRRTVLQLHDCDKMVATVMRASTDRLVLINTPEDGSLLRFDVRQLQEFFAGEQVYVEVGADELRRRFAIIGADAHWREVVHFAISALIEQNRRTEIGVAAEFLRLLDSGDLGSRTLDRRMAIGAIAASRLLREGVLEKDLRIRAVFEPCLDSLCAFGNDDIMLLADAPPRSQRWIVEFMWFRLRERQPSESAGALLLLLRGLDPSDARTSDVVELLLSAEVHLQVFVVRTAMQTAVIRGRLLPRLLLSDEWKRLAPEALSAMTAGSPMQRGGNKGAPEFNEVERALWQRFISATPQRTGDHNERIGPFEIVRSSRMTLRGPRSAPAGPPVRGIFAGLLAVSRWLDELSHSTCVEAAREIAESEGRLMSILRAKAHLAPGRRDLSPEAFRLWLNACSEAEYATWRDAWINEHIGVQVTLASEEVIQEAEMFAAAARILQLYPKLTHLVLHLTTPAWDDNVELDDSFAALGGSLEPHPDYLVCYPGLWSAALAHATNPEALRAKLVAAARAMNRGQTRGMASPHSPLVLRLPEEGELLVVLCMSLRAFSRHPLRGQGQERTERSRSWIVGFVTSPEVLLTVADDSTQRIQVRGCALALWVLVKRSVSEAAPRISILEATARDFPAIVDILASAIEFALLATDKSAQAVLSPVLECIRGTAEWYQAEAFLERWREFSASPVTNLLAEESFLYPE